MSSKRPRHELTIPANATRAICSAAKAHVAMPPSSIVKPVSQTSLGPKASEIRSESRDYDVPAFSLGKAESGLRDSKTIPAQRHQREPQVLMDKGTKRTQKSAANAGSVINPVVQSTRRVVTKNPCRTSASVESIRPTRAISKVATAAESTRRASQVIEAASGKRSTPGVSGSNRGSIGGASKRKADAADMTTSGKRWRG